MPGLALPPLVAFRAYAGDGYLAGEAPTLLDPLDGRTRISGALSRMRVWVFDRQSMQPVESVVSGTNGEWRIDNMLRTREDGSPMHYFIFGPDHNGLVNAAVQDWLVPVET